MNGTVNVGAAIAAIRRRQSVRVYGETPALKLLGIEDKYSARFEWKNAHGKIITPAEQSTFDGVRKEIESRSKDEIAEAREEWKRRNKIDSYFPDTGPFRRELYPRHMEFVRATATDEEVMMLAANRCLTPWSPVETDRGERLALELIGETGFDVRSWDGSSRCTKSASPVFLVGIEPAFQIHLDNGEVFQCSSRHRVLIHGSTDVRLPSDWVSIGHLIRRSDGLHLSRTAQGWRASYGGGDRLCGGPPQSPSGNFGWPLPIRPDVPSNSRQRQRADAAASISADSRACQVSGRPSIGNDQRQLADLIGKISSPGALDFSVPKTVRDRISQRSADESGLDPIALVADLLPSLSRQTSFDELLLAFNSPLLFNGRSIIAVVPLGLQPIIDFTVDGTHDYFSAGIVHHNTGKSQLGAFCVTTWATGRYPTWWDGRRFDGPITAWICNKTAKDVRDINEAELLGPPGSEQDRGTGFIPHHLIQRVTPKPGTPHAFEFISVEHVSGGTSYIVSKSYDQGREAFQGRKIEVGWGDEEIPREIWDEMRMRTVIPGQEVQGVLLATYTPINGLTDMTQWFIESSGSTLESMRKAQDVVEGELVG